MSISNIDIGSCIVTLVTAQCTLCAGGSHTSSTKLYTQPSFVERGAFDDVVNFVHDFSGPTT